MPHPMTKQKTDTQLQEDVLRELKGDTRVHVTDVGVTVKSGVVTLTGEVDSWARRSAALAATLRVAGVLDVANDLRVRMTPATGRTDPEVAEAARRALEWDARVPHQDIQTAVSAGHVSLRGEVDYWSQREDAEEAVRYLNGVTGVTNAISVRPHFVAPSDVRLAIAEALRRHALRETRHIEMSIDDGIVTLSGTVGSWSERRAAVGAAGAIRGVRSVLDHLHVESPDRV